MKRKNRKTVDDIIRAMKKKGLTKEMLLTVKNKCASHNSTEIPGNEDILSILPAKEKKKFLKLLQKKPSRTASGISIVAVMTKPDACPHGTCVYCPTHNGIPQSYVDDEPAVMRGIANGFDPYRQTKCRIGQLKLIGHPTSKIELIVMGGTFTAKPEKYQKSFIKGCYDGLNGFRSKTLSESIKRNETAKNRCVGLTIETRPDEIDKKKTDLLLSLGTTKVEIGVQNPDDSIYRKTKRGHLTKDVVKATELLRDSGLKVCYHLMPNLPGTNFKTDLEMFEKVFSDDRFKPDMIKLYPTLVVDNSELEQLFKKGKYTPYETEELIELIIRMKKIIPKYARIMRLQRDVPKKHIVAGCMYSNLRQIVQVEMEKRNEKCNCIRCREIRHRTVTAKILEKSKITEQVYTASNGFEHFLEYDTTDKHILGILRLRFPHNPGRGEFTKKTAIIRELRVYGPSIPIGKVKKKAVQHKGVGKGLVSKAEGIARNAGKDKMLITSGVGARDYYRRLGYELEGVYMSKKL